MPRTLDEQNDTSNSSDDVTLDEAVDQVADTGADDQAAAGADSSDAQGDNDADLDTRSIVRDVVAKRDPAAAASPAEGQEDGTDPDGTGTQSKEQDDEDYSDVPFHKHPRFQHLLREAKTNRADATRYRNVQTFLDSNGIAAEEAAEGFTIMAAMKTDPVKAWEMLKPHVQSLLQAAGEVLPEDLAQQVQQGVLTPEGARQIARANARAAAVETGRTFEQQQAERRRQQDSVNAIRQSAEDWEQDRQKKDPNFAAKQPLLMKEIAYLQRIEGVPNTPEGVKDQLNRAYKAIPAPAAPRTTPAAPTVRQAATTTRPPVRGGASTSATPAPKSTLDIVRQTRERMRAGQ